MNMLVDVPKETKDVKVVPSPVDPDVRMTHTATLETSLEGNIAAPTSMKLFTPGKTRSSASDGFADLGVQGIEVSLGDSFSEPEIRVHSSAGDNIIQVRESVAKAMIDALKCCYMNGCLEAAEGTDLAAFKEQVLAASKTDKLTYFKVQDKLASDAIAITQKFDKSNSSPKAVMPR